MEEKMLLDSIFDITEQLYAAMRSAEEIPESDHGKIFRLLTELAERLVNADRASFWKWDKREHTLWTTAAVGADRIVVPESTGLVGKALKEKRPLSQMTPTTAPTSTPMLTSPRDTLPVQYW